MTILERNTRGSALRRDPHFWVLLEGVALLAATPLLLFPEARPVATAAVLAALALIWLLSLLSAPELLPATPFNLVLILWCAVLGVSLLVTSDPAATLPKAAGLLLGLAVWRYLNVALSSRARIAAALGALLLTGVGFTLVGVLALEELPKIPALAAINPFGSGHLPFAGGLSIHPNQLAGLICLYLPLIFSLLFAPPARLKTGPARAGLALMAVVVAFILVLTQSRGGWVGAAAGLFALVLFWERIPSSRGARRTMRWLLFVGCLAVLAVFLWIGPAGLRDLWLNPPAQTSLGTFSTLNYRKELWPWAITGIGDFPLTGTGLGAFRQVAFRLYPLSLPANLDIGHAHNIFLQTALDMGLPGLVVYCSILLIAATTGWRIAWHDVGFRPASLGILAGLVGVHVFGMADALALGSKPGLVFWSALGLLAAMNNDRLRRRRVDRP